MALVEEGEKKVMAKGLATGTLILSQEEYEYWRQRDFQIICCVAQHMFVESAKEFKTGMDAFETQRREKN
jgi:hypothetical protein